MDIKIDWMNQNLTLEVETEFTADEPGWAECAPISGGLEVITVNGHIVPENINEDFYNSMVEAAIEAERD